MMGSNGAAGGAWASGLAPVAVAAIPTALAQRWNAIAAEYPSVSSRSASMNMIAYANEISASTEVSGVIGELAATHPVRAITVIDDESATDDNVESYILSGAILARDGKPTCSEEVFLRGNPGSAERMASAVYGLLAADLCVYLWWRAPSPYGTSLFRMIAPFADKVIVDSLRFGDTGAALDTVRRMAEHRVGHVAVADLNWKRILPWRQAIAGSFDDPLTLSLLDEFDRCQIDFAAAAPRDTPPAARATLLAGWIATSVPRLRGRIRIVARETGGEGAGRIEAVGFSSTVSKASLVLRRSREPRGVDASAGDRSGLEFRRWLFPADTLTESELLHLCLDDPFRDPIFEGALATE